MKHLKEAQLGLYFNINNVTPESESLAAEYEVLKAARAEMEKLCLDLPFWKETYDDGDTCYTSNAYEVCEFDPEVAEHEGKVLFSLFIYANREFPAEHIKVLRDTARKAFDTAATKAGLPVQYVQSKMYREWHGSEWEDLDDTDIFDKESLADEEFERYDFGSDATVVEHDGWDTSDPCDLVKMVYVAYDDDPADADSHRISFHVKFDNAGNVSDAYGLSMSNGGTVGSRKAQSPSTP